LAWELVENLTPTSSVIARSAADEAISASDDKIASDALAMTQTLMLLKQFPNAKKIGVIVLSTNRGLVGSLNSNLIGKIKEIDGGNGVKGNHGAHETIAELVVYGKKAKVIAQRMGKNIIADFNKLDRTITTEDIFPLAKLITDSYLTGEYKKIVIIYNHFVSTAVQKPTVKQLLPFGESGQWSVDSGQSLLPTTHYPLPTGSDYLFEPTPTEVLEHLLPRIIESQLYQTILESDASEHSARMIMMKNATDAAGDLVGDLTLTYNRLRQGKITTELAEITAGRIALE
jgi:F-type H+-transporting ATPase subunit gamma